MKRHKLKVRFRINEELSEEERSQELFRVFELPAQPASIRSGSRTAKT